MAAATESPSNLYDKVQNVLNLIRPAVQADGGDIELVAVSEDGVVSIRFHGACHGCRAPRALKSIPRNASQLCECAADCA